MSKNLPSAWISALAAQGITTAYLARFDFKSGVQFVWTGIYPIAPTSTGDSLLDGNTFQPIANGVMYSVASNTYSEKGSDSLKVTLALPANTPPEITASTLDKDEFRARPATLWRALMQTPAGLATPAVWLFRRVRVGSMDTMELDCDGSQNIVKLTIQSHASMISQPSNSLYDDQSRFDPTDTSQNYLASIATGQPLGNTPTSATTIASSYATMRRPDLA